MEDQRRRERADEAERDVAWRAGEAGIDDESPREVRVPAGDDGDEDEHDDDGERATHRLNAARPLRASCDRGAGAACRPLYRSTHPVDRGSHVPYDESSGSPPGVHRRTRRGGDTGMPT